jgi:hypothetical protein
MTTVVKWSNVRVAIQSALGTDIVITAITKANPAVVTANGHGLANGDYVKLGTTTASILGMYQVDARVFRVSLAQSNTFALEGEDSTLYDTFTSGDASLITFGTNMTTATGLTAAGGDFEFIDVTTIHDNIRKQVPGLAAPATYTFENLWDPSDPALLALKVASDNQAQRAVRFTFASSQIVAFVAYVGATLLPAGTAQDKVTTSVVATMFGRPTIYAV